MKLRKKMISKPKNKGFTFVEVVLAIAILALIAVPVFNVIYESYALNLKSRKLMAATDLNAMIMESISNCTFDDYTYTSGSPATEVTVYGLETYYCKDGTKLKKPSTTLYHIFPNSSLLCSNFSRVKNPSTGDFKECNTYLSDVVYNGYHFNILIKISVPLESDKNTKEYKSLVKNVAVSIYDYELNKAGKEDDTLDYDVKMNFNGGTLMYHDVLTSVSTTVPNSYK